MVETLEPHLQLKGILDACDVRYSLSKNGRKFVIPQAGNKKALFELSSMLGVNEHFTSIIGEIVRNRLLGFVPSDKHMVQIGFQSSIAEVPKKTFVEVKKLKADLTPKIKLVRGKQTKSPEFFVSLRSGRQVAAPDAISELLKTYNISHTLEHSTNSHTISIPMKGNEDAFREAGKLLAVNEDGLHVVNRLLGNHYKPTRIADIRLNQMFDSSGAGPIVLTVTKK